MADNTIDNTTNPTNPNDDRPVVLKVDHVAKYFRLPTEQATGLKMAFLNWTKGIKGFTEQHVLKDISFEVRQGDFFGIVGRNGSGKSTLLKIISQIYVPEKGSVSVKGKLVPFIELGVGFNPELTGRENVYLNGALLGFTREEIEDLIRKALTFSAEPPERRQARTKKYLPVYVICCVLGVAEALAVWAAGLADIEGALALLIIGVVFGVVYGAYAMFWMAETLPRYYDENRICNFAQGAFHIHIPGIYYNNRNWKHVLRAFRVWSMASMVLVPPCTAGAVLFERATGWQVWGVVLVVYIASLFGAIVIPAKRFE